MVAACSDLLFFIKVYLKHCHMKTFKNIDNAVVNVKLCFIITLHEHMRGKLTRKVRLFENSQSNFTRISCHLFY